jgi:hypothetical protein
MQLLRGVKWLLNCPPPLGPTYQTAIRCVPLWYTCSLTHFDVGIIWYLCWLFDSGRKDSKARAALIEYLESRVVSPPCNR